MTHWSGEKKDGNPILNAAAALHKPVPENKPVHTDALLNERQTTHGDFRDNAHYSLNLLAVAQANPFWRTADNRWDGWSHLPADQKIALQMIFHKIGRILSGNNAEPDHWEDIAGYAKLVANLIRTGKCYV